MDHSETQPETHICLCLGSSCYSRGNRENLEILQNLLEEGADISLSLEGCLCQGDCGRGPNVVMNGERLSGMTAELFETYLEDLLGHTRT